MYRTEPKPNKKTAFTNEKAKLKQKKILAPLAFALADRKMRGLQVAISQLGGGKVAG